MVCGLGNPGARYARTRHNVGFMAVEAFAHTTGCVWTERGAARIARVSFSGQDLLLMKPLTFMNLSGEAVGPIVRLYQVPVTDLLVVHDDVDLAVGRVLVRAGGGDGGHKGLRSVIDELESPDFARVRIGIGRPERAVEQGITDYVLSEFLEDELEALGSALVLAVVGIQEWAVGGVTRAQNRVNRKARQVIKPSCPERADSPGPLDRKEDS